eukprot:gene3329-3816_t
MSLNYTLEELLNLSLGTPEIGAVNFNCLFAVLNEILKHLGISKKTPGLRNDVKYFIPEKEEIVGELINADASENNEEVTVKEELAGPEKRQHEVALKEELGGPEKRQHEVTVKEELGGPEKRQRGGGDEKSTGENSLHSAKSNASRRHIRVVSPTIRRSSTRMASFTGSGLPDIRLSQFGPALPNEGASNHDILLVAKSLDRRESKTPASDMCHVLNVNRRLEAAEATIQGMTNLIDTVTSDVIDLRDVIVAMQESLEFNRSRSPDNAPKVLVNKKSSPVNMEKDVKDVKDVKGVDGNAMNALNEKLIKLSSVLQDHESLIAKAATKKEIKEFCSAATVEAIVDDKLAANPVSSKSSTCAGQPPKRRESRTKLFQEMINRIVQLEETGEFLNAELGSIRAEVSLKSDKKDEDFVDKLGNEIELLAKEIEKLQVGEKEVHDMKKRLDRLSEECENARVASESIAKDQGTLIKNVNNMEKQLESLSDTVFTKLGVGVQQAPQTDIDAVAKLRTQINGLNEQHNVIENEVHQMNKELDKTNCKVIDLDDIIESLKVSKIGKEYVDEKVSSKADKSELKNKISQDEFDSGLGHLDRSLQDTLQRIEGQDSILKQFVIKIDERFEEKINREDVQKLKEYFEKRMKSIKVKTPEPVLPEENAAGFRKPLLRNFNCISCDRALDLLQEDAMPSLPFNQALPGSRALRPYTTFELEQVRKHMRGEGSNKDRFELAQEREKLQRKLLKLCGAHDLDDLAARKSRSCGGSHTLLDPLKRGMVKATMHCREESMSQIEQELPDDFPNGDVMGQDGHIYKGKMEHLPPLKQKDVSKSPSQADDLMKARPSFQSKPEVGTQPMATTNKA